MLNLSVEVSLGTGYDTVLKYYLTNYLLIGKWKMYIYRSRGNHLNQKIKLSITSRSERPIMYPH